MKKTQRARQIVEQLIAGQDPFNLMKAFGAEIPVLILAEAWTLERRKEIEAEAQAQSMGYRMVDSLVVGDYDLVLWHTEKLQNNPNAYVVSINNAQHNPLSKEAQETKQADTAQPPPLTAIKAKVAQWVEQHDSVIVGSIVPDRNEIYLRMLKRIFPSYGFQPFHANDFKYGFRLSKR